MYRLNLYRFADETLTLALNVPVTTNGAKQSKEELNGVYKQLEYIEGELDKVSDKPFRINSSSLSSSIKQLETLRTLLNSMSPGGTEIGTSIAALDKAGVLGNLPTATQRILQDFGKLQNIVNDPEATKNLQISLDALISSLKTADDLVKNTKNDTDRVGEEIKDNEEKQKNFNNEVSKSGGLVNQLKNRFNMLNAVQLVYLYRTVRRVTSGLVQTVENAAAYEESINLYTMALGKYVEQASEWKDRITGALMLDPKQVMQYTGAFYNLTKGMGVASDQAYIMATNLTQLTYDMASYLNLSDEAAQAKIQSAMAGQSRAVATVGIATQAASLQELAYSLNIKKKVANMTQAEKTYLRYIQLMRNTTQMQGDLGRTLITPANAIRVFKTQITLLSQAIGQVLTPIIMSAMPYLIAFTNVLRNAAQKLAAFLGYKLADVDYSTAFEDITDGLENVGKTADGTGKKIKNGLAPFDELNQVMSEKSGTGSGSGDDITGKLKKYVTGYDMLKDLNTQLTDKAKSLEGTMTNFLKIAGGFAAVLTIYRVVKGVTNGILGIAEVGNKLKKIAGWFGIGKSSSSSDAVKKVLDETGEVGKQAKNSEKAITLPSWKTIGKGLLELAAVVTAVIAYTMVLGEFMKIPGHREAITEGISSLREVFFGIGSIALPLTGTIATIAILGQNISVGKMVAGLADLATVILGTEAIVLAAGWIASSNEAQGFISTGIDTLKKVFWGVADIALPLAGVTAALAYLGLLATGSGGMSYIVILAGLGALGEIIIGFKSLVEIIGEFMSSNSSLENLDKGFDVLNRLADGIGEFAGHLIGSIGVGLADTLPKIGNDLAEFGKNAKPFFDDIKGMDAGAMQGAKNLSETILMLTTASLIDGIARFLSLGQASLSSFGKQLPEFGKALKEYAKEIDGIDSEAVSNSANAAKLLAEVDNSLPNTGGKLQKWLGWKDLGAFGNSLKTLGEGINKFGDEVKGINTESVNKATDSAKMLAELNNNLPNTGGILQKWTGWKDLGNFNQALPKLGMAIYGFYYEVKNIDSDIVSKAANSAKALSDFANNLPSYDGIKQWFTGQYKITDFGSDLSTFGTKFKQYYDKLNGTDYTKLTLVYLHLNDIVDTLIKIKNQGLNAVLTTFSDNLTSLGGAFNAVKITGTVSENLKKFGEAVGTKIKDGVKKTLKGTVSIKNMWGQETDKYSVSLFAEGGLPKSGDLFAMNEDGRAEYMASIGNRTAVVNQDQMIQSLATVITNAMTNMGFGNNQKGDTIVYIGNKKVYEGQGEYQNRENDRYGTSVVRV